MEDIPPEQLPGVRLRSGPCSNILDRSLMFLACLSLEKTHAVHCNCTVPGDPDQTKRPTRQLAPSASARSSAQQPKKPDLKQINRPHSCARPPWESTTAEQANARGRRSGLCCAQAWSMGAELGAPDRLRQQVLPADQRHVMAFQELQLLQRDRDHQILRTALSGAERITSAASEPKATKAAPPAALPGGEPPSSESVQGSWFAEIDSVVRLLAQGPPTT